MKFIVAYVAAALTFLALDAAWLGYVAHSFYRNEMGPLLAERFNMVAAVAFYAVFVLGLIVFAVAPALETGGVSRAAIWGAMFGFVAYATYDLTNLATLKGFSLKLALVDMAWGTFISATCAAAGAKAAQYA